MSDDLDGVDMAIMAKFKPRAAHTAAGRRVGETRPVHSSDGRALRATGRTAQMNLKVRPEFRQHVMDLAARDGIMMVEYIERAVAAYAKRGG